MSLAGFKRTPSPPLPPIMRDPSLSSPPPPSKEPFKSFINKVGTFRSKKNVSNRPSASDLRFTDSNDEKIQVQFRSDENSNSLHDSDLDTTSKSFSGGALANSDRDILESVISKKQDPTLSSYF